jgi:hypothetical protein
MRLGQLLVAAHLVTPQQLEEALAAQVLHGGRLGTNLIEQGHLRLDALAETLARQHGIGPALKRHFDRADPALQARLPAEIAARHRAVPLGPDDREPDTVAVAVTDPLDAAALAELAQYLGAPVVSAVAAELRVLYYLEHIYGVGRESRFLRVPPADPDASEWAPQPTPPGKRPERRRFLTTLSDLPALAEDDEDESGAPLGRIKIERVAVSAPPGEGEPVSAASVEEVTRAIRQATGRDRVGDLVVSALRDCFDQRLDVGAILVVRGTIAVGWKGFVRGGDDALVAAVAVPLEQPSLLSGAYRDRAAQLGTPAGGGSELDRRLWAALGTPPPAEALVVPVSLQGQVVCLLYAQSEEQHALGGGVLHHALELAECAATAFDRLIRAAQR